MGAPLGTARPTRRTARTRSIVCSGGCPTGSSSFSFTGAIAATRPSRGLARRTATGSRCAATACCAISRRAFTTCIFISRTGRPISGLTVRGVSRNLQPEGLGVIRVTGTVSATASVSTSSSSATRLATTAALFEVWVSPASTAATATVAIIRGSTVVCGTRKRSRGGVSTSDVVPYAGTGLSTRPITFLGS